MSKKEMQAQNRAQDFVSISQESAMDEKERKAQISAETFVSISFVFLYTFLFILFTNDDENLDLLTMIVLTPFVSLFSIFLFYPVALFSTFLFKKIFKKTYKFIVDCCYD